MRPRQRHGRGAGGARCWVTSQRLRAFNAPLGRPLSPPPPTPSFPRGCSSGSGRARLGSFCCPTCSSWLFRPRGLLPRLLLRTHKLSLATTELERTHSTPITTAAISEFGARGEGGNPVSLSLHLWLAQLLLTSVKLSPPLIWIHFSRRQW